MKAKFLLSMAALFSTTAPLLTNSSEQNTRKSFNEKAELQISEIEKDLKLNSKIIGSEVLYNYQGEQYRDKNSILSQEFLKNPILQETTSSNPNKIIKNYSTNELDPDKLYGVHSNDFVKVYKNALGKVTLPSCLPGQNSGCYQDPINKETKSAQERALDSYVNKGLIRPKYSYDSLKWFDSEFEAKKAFQKNNATIKQSLFYFHNGIYYNAFNKKDMTDLQSKMHKGYYYDAFKTKYDADGLMYEEKNSPLKNTMNQSPLEDSFRYKEDYFNDYFYDNFWSYFSSNIDDIISNQFKYKITLTAPSGQWFELIQNNLEGIDIKVLNSGKKLEISVSDKGRGQIVLTEFMNSLNTRGSWTEHMVSDYCSLVKNNRRQWHDFKYYDSLNGKKYIMFRLDTNNDRCVQSGYNDTNPEKIIIDKEEIKDENYEINFLGNNFINKLDSAFSFKKNLFNESEIINSIAKQNGISFKETLQKIANFTKLSQFSEVQKKVVFNSIYDELFKNLYNTDIKSSPIYDDWLYGKTLDNKKTKYQFSFRESQLFFQSEILKNVQNKNSKNVTLDIGDIEFTTTFENWKNNFYYLDNDKNNNGIRIKRMYYVDNNDKKDISDFSDQLNENIASNPNAAKEIMFQNSLQILRKAYEIYDINGKVYFSRKNEEEVIIELQKQIELSYKYIHKNESVNLKDQEKDWENIISDGKYTVFKFKLNTGKWVYYKDYQSALELYKNQLSIINSISEEFIIYKMYSTIINNKLVTYEWNSKTNTRNLSENIYNDIIRNGEN
ncbi:hypothetical protein [Spiroplasma endosymbiont of Dioctria linearis]|uniref:hypothetical protein n=1 Tax=Spiroplasma endosymbiont of Dioctria linearis TaxID=3066290 RepID=UPI00313C2D84